MNFGKHKNTPTQVEVRQAFRTPADESAVRALMIETFEYHNRVGANEPSLVFKPQAQASYLEECISVLVYGNEGYEPARTFLAWQGEKAVGYLLARISRDYYYSTEYFGYIEQLIVTESARNSGTGIKLLEASYDWFTIRNISTITLKVYGPNQKALNFYEREGFKPLRIELVKHI